MRSGNYENWLSESKPPRQKRIGVRLCSPLMASQGDDDDDRNEDIDALRRAILNEKVCSHGVLSVSLSLSLSLFVWRHQPFFTAYGRLVML